MLYSRTVDASDCHCPHQAIISCFADVYKTACKTTFHFALMGKITHFTCCCIFRDSKGKITSNILPSYDGPQCSAAEVCEARFSIISGFLNQTALYFDISSVETDQKSQIFQSCNMTRGKKEPLLRKKVYIFDFRISILINKSSSVQTLGVQGKLHEKVHFGCAVLAQAPSLVEGLCLLKVFPISLFHLIPFL